MLITQLKHKEELEKIFLDVPVFVLKCYGCKEVFFPADEIERFLSSLPENILSGNLFVDYLCNFEFATVYIKKYQTEIVNSGRVVIFSCGIGVQTVFSALSEMKSTPIVYTGCDTFYINGFQGLTSKQFNCNLCGECYLNFTGGICPITNCSKSLLNGPCGGAKNGKCEIDKELDCGWEKIYNRLKKMNKLESLHRPIKLRDYSKMFS